MKRPLCASLLAMSSPVHASPVHAVARACVARACVARACVARACVARACVARACVARASRAAREAVRLIIDAVAQGVGCPLPSTRVPAAAPDAAIEAGYGESDNAAIVETWRLARRAGRTSS